MLCYCLYNLISSKQRMAYYDYKPSINRALMLIIIVLNVKLLECILLSLYTLTAKKPVSSWFSHWKKQFRCFITIFPFLGLI